MNNAQALLILSDYPNDPVARTALRHNNCELFHRVITKVWGGYTPLVFELLLTQCAEGAKAFVAWRDDPTDFLTAWVEHESRVLYSRSKMSVNPPNNFIKEEKMSEVSVLNPEAAISSTEKATIQREVCMKLGHLFHRLDYVYARDIHGKAFKGNNGWGEATKHERLFCARCTEVVEVEICPPLEMRYRNRGKNNHQQVDANTQAPAAAAA